MRFSNIFGLIVDLTPLKDCGEFKRSFYEIISPELELNSWLSGRVISRPYDHYNK